jgi:hypothetical protein
MPSVGVNTLLLRMVFEKMLDRLSKMCYNRVILRNKQQE